ncbi:MAG: VOC family protein [Patescibacteria group bacterium]
MAHNRPVHFEIHAEDPERAAKFYGDVFGWTTKKYEFPGFDYWIVMTGPESKDPANMENPGINGGILKRRGPAPAGDAPVNGYVCTMTVENIDETIAKIQKAGGEEALAKNNMPGVGWLAYYKDTEDNIFGVLQEEVK